MYNYGKTNESKTMKVMTGIILSRRRLKKPRLQWLQKVKIRGNITTTPLFLVDGQASLSNSAASSNNPPLDGYGMSAPSASLTSSVSSPSSTTTRPPPQQEDQSNVIEGAPVSNMVSTEEKNMSNPTAATLSHGVISVIGRRRSMEDAVTAAPAFVNTINKPHHLSNKKGLAELMSYDFFAVYDGHEGHRVAQRCKERLHHLVVEQLLVTVGGVDHCWESVMATSFARMDEEIAKEDGVSLAAAAEDPMGSTALVVLVGEEEIVVANSGDSRVILCCDSAALALSRDPKCNRPHEKDRVRAAGGDEYLNPYVISAPEVTVHKRTISDCFLVIASDGLWDVVSNETACDLVKKCCSGEVISRRMLEGAIGNCAAASAAMLVELALARGSKDNISVIVVELQHLHDSGSSSST